MSAPPHASSWAAPPEFYIDENMVGKTVRRFIIDLGYIVHTPAEVFGRRRLEEGLDDDAWLPVIGAKGWVLFCRDQHILHRELELQAYLKAKVHMFLFPGSATRAQLIDLFTINLAQVGALAVARKPNVYWMTPTGVIEYERRRDALSRRRRPRPA